GFSREPVVAAKPAGLTVEGSALTIAPDAPQWQALKLGIVTTADTRLTDPVPARVAIDETRASKVQTSLSGRVGQVFVDRGQQVGPDAGTAQMVIADLASVWVLADLFESDATQIKEGSRAVVTSPSIPGLNAEGTVAMVSAVVDPDRHTVPIRVRLANPDGVLRPNTYARVRFAT